MGKCARLIKRCTPQHSFDTGVVKHGHERWCPWFSINGGQAIYMGMVDSKKEALALAAQQARRQIATLPAPKPVFFPASLRA